MKDPRWRQLDEVENLANLDNLEELAISDITACRSSVAGRGGFVNATAGSGG